MFTSQINLSNGDAHHAVVKEFHPANFSLMNPVEVIRKKRDRTALSRAELEAFITGYVRGEVPDYQMSAFLMAVYFNGMTREETLALTDIMLSSGKVLDLSSIPGPKADKHSTGGVGDKVSLILAPMVAVCGVSVPMVSGRGLGHTGGTLDKLESIPGFRTNLSSVEFKQIVGELGVALGGQTHEIAPADRMMYALRDVTATVNCIPLIAGSIMSKKLAEGIDALVLDVKTGNGAFMQTYEDSVALANALVALGNSKGTKTVGFITDMDQPLGFMIGNWLEVVECVECLRGKNVPDLMEVTLVLGGAMLHLAGKADSIEDGMKRCHSAIWSGKAYEKLLQVIRRQGGDVSMIQHPEVYPQAAHCVEVQSPVGGYVSGFHTGKIGLLAMELGAGRLKIDDVIDPKAGIAIRKKIGDSVEKNETLAVMYTDRKNLLDRAVQELQSYVTISETRVTYRSRIRAFVDSDGVHQWTAPPLY